ncbi:TPA: hypothetical protein EYP44_01135 [Candidatus Bathyarchaeota archaeon]|nr:hypothetical protein [Candidatus Bathyarchaeota archaeon]
MSVKRSVLYFSAPGPQNTDAVIKAVRRRANELGIKYVVVASESGKTALKEQRLSRILISKSSASRPMRGFGGHTRRSGLA